MVDSKISDLGILAEYSAGDLLISSDLDQIEIQIPRCRTRFFKLLFHKREKILFGMEDHGVLYAPRIFKICHQDEVDSFYFAIVSEEFFDEDSKKMKRNFKGLWLRLKSGLTHLLIPCDQEEFDRFKNYYDEILQKENFQNSEEHFKTDAFPYYENKIDYMSFLVITFFVIGTGLALVLLM